jgi:hypothetical protein
VECCEYTIKAKSEMQDASKRIIAAAESQPEVSRDRKCESRTEAAIFLFRHGVGVQRLTGKDTLFAQPSLRQSRFQVRIRAEEGTPALSPNFLPPIGQ